jgi:hypothetical protein
MLFWNENVYDVLPLPNKDIADILTQIAEEGQKNAEE